MKVKQLASEIAKREGKKSQTPIGNIREIVGRGGPLDDLQARHEAFTKKILDFTAEQPKSNPDAQADQVLLDRIHKISDELAAPKDLPRLTDDQRQLLMQKKVAADWDAPGAFQHRMEMTKVIRPTDLFCTCHTCRPPLVDRPYDPGVKFLESLEGPKTEPFKNVVKLTHGKSGDPVLQFIILVALFAIGLLFAGAIGGRG